MSKIDESPALLVRNLGKQVPVSEGQLMILQSVDFALAAGQTLAIVGASGSGKSTLLGLLAGLDVPSAGSVELLGTDLAGLDEDARARLRAGAVGFVFQAFHLLPALNALENVMLPLELAGLEAEQRARALLDEVGLHDRMRHYPKQLSGGEQQRVALARALARAPKVLFADEPTGNLDHATGGQIIELLFALNAKHGTTLVLVTHASALAARCSHRLTLDHGRAVYL